MKDQESIKYAKERIAELEDIPVELMSYCGVGLRHFTKTEQAKILYDECNRLHANSLSKWTSKYKGHK